MKITLATVGCFHIFPLAKELERLGYLERIYSGFPWERLKREGIARNKVAPFPVIRPLLMAMRHSPFKVPQSLRDALHHASVVTLDQYVARTMPECDVYVGHEGVGLISGGQAQARGTLYVCDRGCTHMAWREATLAAEYDRLGLPSRPRPRTYSREIEEYHRADLIMVPSDFVKDSFISMGFSKDKVVVVPYGVNLERFSPVDRPGTSVFDILFVGRVSIRKGIGDLLKAFDLAPISNKRLTLVGEIDDDVRLLYAAQLSDNRILHLGHVGHGELKSIFSRSHAFCLPSIEEGMAMVVAEAMACACPPIVTRNTGATSLVRDGENGFVVGVHEPEAIAVALEKIYRDPSLRESLGAAALETVASQGGWSTYGKQATAAYKRALQLVPN